MALESFLKSPLNYTGGKSKLLSRILPEFPERIHTFVDLFAGGFNVGINVEADTICCNDQITYLIGMFQRFRDTPYDDLIERIRDRIAEFGLTDQNAAGYLLFRDEYNRTKDVLDLFVLTSFAFNHQIRFNNSHKFNSPFGKDRSAFNDSIERNFFQFCAALKRKRIVFSSLDFRAFDMSSLGPDDFVYCDPPYLISTGSYNDGNRGFKDWTTGEESALHSLLDRLDAQGVRFALSNVLRHKGASNDLLFEWSRTYKVIPFDKSYANSSYHFKDRSTETEEVLITNYEREQRTWRQLELP